MARLEAAGMRAVGAAGWFKRVLRGAACVGMLASPEAPAATAPVADPAACRIVRLSDIGWTDVTATTALFAGLIRHLGYRPEITVLSLPVTYASMKNKDIDVFLGNWMPSQGGDRKSYVADGSVEVIRANLTGAKYTLAVPAYTNDAGLRSFADIQRYAAQLNNSIYGIEPGNDGNRLVLGMLRQNLFGLGGFKLVESSEQGMLAEVERAFHAHANEHALRSALPVRRRCGLRTKLRRGAR
jgi:glycine betaine/proline transport system substrate-binding protein